MSSTLEEMEDESQRIQEIDPNIIMLNFSKNILKLCRRLKKERLKRQ